jgi:hypothetical protein
MYSPSYLHVQGLVQADEAIHGIVVAHPRSHLQARVDGAGQLGPRAGDRLVLLLHLAVVGRRARDEAGLQVPKLGDVGGRALEIVGRQGAAQAIDRVGAADSRGDVGQRPVDARLGDVQLAHFAADPLRQGRGGGDAGGQGLGVRFEGAQGL